ncbi:sugar transferase [Pygmaiobacter massiliensis]|uniref:sugar transferase n=1 Tax=Pygmaiobacter massiliensis TaxID=1917873 RepID=UPI000C7CBC9B|nr:sugar transferase [Pygmaiobacter massiliensis]
MTEFKHNLALRIVKIINVCMITLPFFLCWYCYYANRVSSPYYAKGNMLIVALYFILYIMIGRVYDAFWMSTQRISEIIYAQTLAAAVCDGIMYIVIWLLSKHLPNILPGLAAFVGQILLATAWALLANHWYFRTSPPQPTAIIYDERRGLLKLIDEYGMDKKYNVQLTANVSECLQNLDMLAQMKVVFLSGIHSHDRNVILKYCIANDINVFVIPRVGDAIMSGARPMHMFHLPILQVGRYMAQPEYLFTKRTMDIILSLVAIVITSPIMLVTALAIYGYDRKPVLYKQIRLGKDGRPFKILKFRSMQIDAEKDGVARLSTGDKDDRITPVGKFIRKCRIDELPQLFNILVGSLSIVGPRPERPEIAAQYCEEMPEFSLRLQAKAGLTGYAQVYGKYNTTPYDKLQMDLMYIAHPSIIEDLKIMLATVKILFVPDSTEGVAEGKTTAMSE